MVPDHRKGPDRVNPTCVGMNRTVRLPEKLLHRKPHMRGDEPVGDAIKEFSIR